MDEGSDYTILISNASDKTQSLQSGISLKTYFFNGSDSLNSLINESMVSFTEMIFVAK